MPEAPHKVSVLIATYNRAQLLRENAASILGQDYPDYELVYVDDGSTDDTPAVLAEIQAERPDRVKVIRIPNGGPGPARNAGAKLCSGAYLLITDDDVAAPPDWISSLARRRAEIGCDVLAYAFAPYSEASRPERYMCCRNLLVTGRKPRWDYVGPALFLMERALFEAVGGFHAERLTAAEDFELCNKLRARGVRIFFDPAIRVRHHFPQEWAGVVKRVKATAAHGIYLYNILGKPIAPLMFRSLLKFLGSPIWSLRYYPLDLYTASLRMEWLFFCERCRTYAVEQHRTSAPK